MLRSYYLIAGLIIAGAASSVMAAFAFGVFGFYLFNWCTKFRLTGTFEASIVEEDGNLTKWGTVEIKYHPLSINTHHTPVKMFLRLNDIILEGDGLIVDNRYLIGHYCETGKTERRRAGSFMYELDGTGTVWSGRYTHIDPENATPLVDNAVWRRL